MPVYEYKCGACGGRFDRFIRSTDEQQEAEKGCPFCGSEKVSKVFSIFGTGFSGGGESPGSSGCGRKST